MRPLLYILSLIQIQFSASLYAQNISLPPGNCTNAGFESGTMEGYSTYYGTIDHFGNVVINTPGIDPNQFQIMTKQSELQGLDPNAWANCIENKILPVVPPGTGRYTLRLGDLQGGSKAARIVLEFTVTPELSFFLLNYAVVLEDPSHEYFEQPRFELYIKDAFGQTLNCGEYKVRAAAEIPGFESCQRDLRVRPWTSAGFELQSYLNQTIRIEILITDCSQSGHGGYAYIDASCKPLELILDGYCPGSETATYIITDGFEKYKWSTGDTTNSITINNPTAGNIYSVTLTSATGCTLILKDTLPEFAELQLANLNSLTDTTICLGDAYWVIPTGDNLPFIYCPELGYSADSFFIEPSDTTTYSFISRDDFGCMSDTVSTTVNVLSMDFDVNVIDPCGVTEYGELTIIPSGGDSPYIVTLNSVNYIDKLNFTGLAPGNYQIRLEDANGCSLSKTAKITLKPVPIIDTVLITPATCGLDNAAILIRPIGGISQHQYSLDNITYANSNTITGMNSGFYWVYIKNQYGCLDSVEIFIGQYDMPHVQSVVVDSSTCGQANGQLSISADGGFGQLSFSINNISFQNSPIFQNLNAGAYSLFVKDQAGCITILPFRIHDVAIPKFIALETTSANCREDNGIAEIIVTSGRPPYEFKLNNQLINHDGIFEALASGTYSILVTDDLGCIIQSSFEIGEVFPPFISGFHFIPQDCGTNYVAASVSVDDGVKPYNYSFDDGSTWQMDSVSYRIKEGSIPLRIVDASGCPTDSLIVLAEKVRLYIPNIFSPNNDGINEKFVPSISTGADAFVQTYQIFDRWGSLMYDAYDFPITSPDHWWIGTFNGSKKVEAGVYVYVIQILLEDGRMICRQGDVTVLH